VMVMAKNARPAKEGNRVARAVGRGIQFADRVRRSRIVVCSLFAELFFSALAASPVLCRGKTGCIL
jgi:hypothetical protein